MYFVNEEMEEIHANFIRKETLHHSSIRKVDFRRNLYYKNVIYLMIKGLIIKGMNDPEHFVGH